jgi:hypothetical protein
MSGYPVRRDAVLLLGRNLELADRSLHGFLCARRFKLTQLSCTGTGNPRHAPARGSSHLFLPCAEDRHWRR